MAQQQPSGPGSPHYRGLTITLRHTTVCRTSLDEYSARRRDLNLTKNTSLTRDRLPCPQRDSNQQSQEARGRRTTPLSARPPGLAVCNFSTVNHRTARYLGISTEPRGTQTLLSLRQHFEQ